MVSKKIVIESELGIHLRPAGQLADEGLRHKCAITLSREGRSVNGKSLLSILSLGIRQGYEVEIQCDGPGEEEALAAFVKILTQHNEA